MAAKVLDSWALLALFKGEPAGKAVADLLARATADKARLLLCVVNWGEVYTSMHRAGSRTTAESAADDMARLPIELIPVETDLALVRLAATYKATHKMSCGDCFAAALARLRKAELVTGDCDFRVVEDEVRIAWLK